VKTQQLNFIAAVSLCVAIIIPNIASAASIPTQGDWATTLQARYIGNTTTPNAYYDTSLGITWLADANAVVGSVYDTYIPGSGSMNWSTASTWATNLNINGVTGWSLPTMTDSNATCGTYTYTGNATYSGGPCGYNNPSTSEMAHLFYTTLGNKAYYDTSGFAQSGYGVTNSGPFSNIQSNYWSATAYAPNTANLVWQFGPISGGQLPGSWYYTAQAWAVHAGDVGTAIATVPIPAAAWLFGSGLMGLVGMGRRQAA
jgi:hypothetical protein